MRRIRGLIIVSTGTKIKLGARRVPVEACLRRIPLLNRELAVESCAITDLCADLLRK